MKKKSKIILSIISGLIIMALLFFILYNALITETTLTITERKWIDANSTNVTSISVPNNIAVFGDNGTGVFYDYVNYLKDEVGLNININSVDYNNTSESYRFEITNNYNPTALTIYKDHFVLVSKVSNINYTSEEIYNSKPLIISKYADLIKNYYEVNDDVFVVKDSYNDIADELSNQTSLFALVPLNEFISLIISNNFNINNHISDLNIYYNFEMGDNSILNEILSKKLNSWIEQNYKKSYNTNLYNLFINKLYIIAQEEDSLTSKVYKYGFNEVKPYEIIYSGEIGGIVSEYLKKFSDFSNIEFAYKKYKSSEDLATAAINNDLDLYYNYYNLITNYIDCGELFEINYYVIAKNTLDLSMTNINGLANKTVYVLKNSYLYDAIKNISGIDIVTYESSSQLKKILKNENIVVIDSISYDHFITTFNDEYSIRYKGKLKNETYSFRYINNTDAFYKLFNAYTKILDPSDLVRTGSITFNKVNNKGNVISKTVIYSLVLLGVIFITFILSHRSNKKVHLDTKVKKDDRIKYVDLLTSLKNRNYYNEKVNVWNKNTIYPQTTIVMDINRIKELNDSYGHEEGDKQIKAVANILIKNQIDNTEIIRTDGNEFLLYLVGYSEKQITIYMKKLLKEFKKLPYDFGVAMGFSMILDDTKLVEDAFNEASIQMRENKNMLEDSNEQED